MFIDWVKKQLEERGMSLRELARKGKISHASASRILSGDQAVSRSFCVAIAQALGLPTDDVLAKAGFTDTPTKEYTEMPELFDIAKELTYQQYKDAVVLLDMLRRGVIVVKCQEKQSGVTANGKRIKAKLEVDSD